MEVMFIGCYSIPVLGMVSVMVLPGVLSAHTEKYPREAEQ